MTKKNDDTKIDDAVKANKTHLALIVDESGSMETLREAVVTGVNEFLGRFRKNPKKTRVTLGFFDSNSRIAGKRLRSPILTESVVAADPILRFPLFDAKMKSVDDIKFDDYNPRGMTPLNDAIVETIERVGAVVDSETVVFVAILTDGQENASVASSEFVASLIKAKEDQGWSFVYIGANVNAEHEAGKIGLGAPGKAFNVGATRGGMRSSMANAAAMGATRSMLSADAAGAHAHAVATMDYYNETGGKLKDLADDESADSVSIVQ